jgi:hypothetical protein
MIKKPITAASTLNSFFLNITTQTYGAVLWTQDDDFEGLTGVKYFPKTTLPP